MIYEFRTYEVIPGRMPALNTRFQEHTLGFFGKHGIRPVGFWETVIGTRDVLSYLVVFEDLAHRQRAWNAFLADQEWTKVRDESQRDGPMVGRIRNEIWQPTRYSPLQ